MRKTCLEAQVGDSKERLSRKTNGVAPKYYFQLSTTSKIHLSIYLQVNFEMAQLAGKFLGAVTTFIAGERTEIEKKLDTALSKENWGAVSIPFFLQFSIFHFFFSA